MIAMKYNKGCMLPISHALLSHYTYRKTNSRQDKHNHSNLLAQIPADRAQTDRVQGGSSFAVMLGVKRLGHLG